MQYPKKLKDLAIKRMTDFPVEGFLSGQGPTEPKLFLLGEAPGKTEIETHIPFSGKAGNELICSLEQIGLSRNDVYITSTVRSRPYQIPRVSDPAATNIRQLPNRKPTKKEVFAHAPLLDFEIHSIRPTLIATLGSVALERLLGNQTKLSNVHGTVYQGPIRQLNSSFTAYEWTTDQYRVFPLYHPAAVFYNRKLAVQIQEDWLTLQKIICCYL